MNPLEQLFARTGKVRVPVQEPGARFRRGGVENTAELQRVLELPRYRWQDDPDLPELGRDLERWLSLPARTDCRRRCGHTERRKDCPECVRASEACVCRGDGGMHLRPVQVAALQAMHDHGGMLGPIRVGGGKTLLSYLAGVVLGAERVMLCIPAKLKEKTKRDFALLRRHWQHPVRMHLMSYELLSRDRGVAELEAYRPDLVIADEAHKFKSVSAACTKRIRRYLQEQNPEAHYVDMSGTVTKRSILEYAHRLHWAIPDGLQALPRRYNETRDWADAVDEKVSAAGRLMPGALLQFCTPEELSEIGNDHRKATAVRVVRSAYCRRLMSSPGVCGTEEQFDGAMSLILQGQEFPVGDKVVSAFEGLRTRWELPDGQPIDMPATLWRHCRSLVQGFWYRWRVPPPPAWLAARRAWAQVEREALKNFHDIDSPLGVVRAIDDGRIPWGAEPLEAWRAVKDSFVPETVAEWVDDACLRWAADWAKDHRGIIWVHEVAFGERLSRETGLPYYGAKGLCDGRPIEQESRACIASIQANSEGRNLQQFSENLIVSVPPGGAIWEQLLGRTHRDGQDADEVSGDVLLGCYEQWDAFRQARRDAEYIERTTAQCQKLNFADVTVAEDAEIERRHRSGDPLWSKANATFWADESWTEEELRVSGLGARARADLRRGQ